MSLLKNLFGGLILVYDQPFQVGDKIRVGGTYGEVKSIGLRSTRIVTPDDNLVSVPNAQVVLTPADWTVVRNIDGTRTVAEIAGAARKSLFETCSSLDGLIRAGLVLPLAGSGDAGECASRSEVEGREIVATV